MYQRKEDLDKSLVERIDKQLIEYSNESLRNGGPAVQSNAQLATMLLKDKQSALTANNATKLLLNGEEKFPEVLKALEKAKHHIHLEYYIFEDGEIGRALEEVLCRKAREGVQVRFIYDDFGSRSIRKTLIPRLKKAGVEAFAFHEIIFIAVANRMNYRNHRKIIIVDGKIGFIGGINVSDRYINKENSTLPYWRDTHLMIEGPGVQFLQTVFLADWNFCTNKDIKPTPEYYPPIRELPIYGDKVVQIAASGPDCDQPTVLFSMLQVIHGAKKELLIATPYFIPGESLINALCVSALGGVKVKLLVPLESDSAFVNSAARSYYNELLYVGVEIYCYKKGFMHAKTMVADQKIAVIGTANMDHRSFDLNFEVNAIVYDTEFATLLRQSFEKDLEDAELIDPVVWRNRPVYKKMINKIARLLSPLL